MSHDNINETAPEKSIWGYKGLIAGALFFGLFLFGFFMAATSEPDYMPSQQVKRQQEALAQQKAQQAANPTSATTAETATAEAPKDTATATAPSDTTATDAPKDTTTATAATETDATKAMADDKKTQQ